MPCNDGGCLSCFSNGCFSCFPNGCLLFLRWRFSCFFYGCVSRAFPTKGRVAWRSDTLLTSRLGGECTSIRGQLNITIQVTVQSLCACLHWHILGVPIENSRLTQLPNFQQPTTLLSTDSFLPTSTCLPSRALPNSSPDMPCTSAFFPCPFFNPQFNRRQKLLPACCVTYYHTLPALRDKCACGASELDATCGSVCCCATALKVSIMHPSLLSPGCKEGCSKCGVRAAFSSFRLQLGGLNAVADHFPVGYMVLQEKNPDERCSILREFMWVDFWLEKLVREACCKTR